VTEDKGLLRGLAHFRSEYAANEGEFLRDLAKKGQFPRALYVGCSDSRVVPELLTGSRPGDLFVVRNVGNIIPPFQKDYVSVGAAVEFGIEILRVPHLIVCGHDGCGGVRATLEGRDKITHMPSLHRWLEFAEKAIDRLRPLGLSPDELMAAAVEENVLRQMDNLITHPCVARALSEHRLQLHGWVYDISDGSTRVYDVDREEFVPSQELEVDLDQQPGR
jgi:carbonic anhydrase